MPKRELIVIGASAGGVEALRVLAGGLPPELPASICVVVHGARELPEILNAAGPLPASHAVEGSPLQPGHIYVAPYDRHLLVEAGRLRLVHGPRENRHRPAVNPLFRSAARAYGPTAVGVILTGALDDGTSGLWELKQSGGVAVVQDPADAAFGGMPRSALEFVEADYTAPLSEIPLLLTQLTMEETRISPPRSEKPMKAVSTELTCPECRGPVHEEHRGRLIEYRCRVGHAYSPRTMAHAHVEAEERALWAAVVALEEGAELAEKLALEWGQSYGNDAREKRHRAGQLRQMLQQLRCPEDQRSA